MTIDSQVTKWGNSLAVRLPKVIARQAGVSEGDQVSVSVATDGSIVLRGVRRKYSLQELVSGITPRNRRRETDWGGPAGGESW
jgi:antitoxin MazE